MSPYSWRPSNYLCPECKRRLEAKAGPDGLKAERCPNCEWSKVFDPSADEFPSRELERARLATDGGCEVDASVFEDYGFPAPDAMARGSDAQHRVWRVLESQGDATIQEVVDATGLSYQTAGRYLRLFEAVCPSISKRPFFEDARITVFDLESVGGEHVAE